MQNHPKEAAANQAAPSSVPSNRGLVDKNGIPTDIEGDLSAGLKSADFEDMAFEYFQNHKNMFKIEDARKEFRLAGVSHDKLVGDYLVRLDQIVNGVPVQFGFYRLNFDQNKKLRKVYGQIDPEARKINTAPAMSEDQAKSIALNDPKHKDAKPEISSIGLMIGRIDGELKLFWSIGLINGGGVGSWNYKVDAQTGKIFTCESALID